jgi:hypothetical protein
VSRNIQPGEKGKANLVSHYKNFSQNSSIVPPFSSALNYDAKVWEYLKPGDLFWNVAGTINTKINKQTINSYRPWN